MEPQQPAYVEADESRSLWLDGGADRLEPHEQPLPEVGYAGRIRGNEREAGTAGERLSQTHPGMEAERLGRQRDFADQLGAAGLGSKRSGSLQQLGSALGRDGELETGYEDTCDHGEHMFA
jgi:hypothetical protein